MLNPYSEQERLAAMVSACYRASRAHFNHLPIRAIINPPQDMFDAKLARQIAIHIMNVEFDIPRRRIVAMLAVGRWMVRQSIVVVDVRREEPVFDSAYRRIAARANELFMTALQESAQEDAA